MNQPEKQKQEWSVEALIPSETATMVARRASYAHPEWTYTTKLTENPALTKIIAMWRPYYDKDTAPRVFAAYSDGKVIGIAGVAKENLPVETEKPKCATCNTNRHKRVFYTTNTHEWVGETCFTKATTRARKYNLGGLFEHPLNDVVEYAEQSILEGKRLDTLRVLAEALVSIEEFGYVSRKNSDYSYNLPTAERILLSIDSPPSAEVSREMLTASLILLWVEEEFTPTSDFQKSVAFLSTLDEILESSVGALAYLPELYRRENLPEPPESNNQHLGTLGERIDLGVTVTRIKEIDSMYGPSLLISGVDENGYAICWFDRHLGLDVKVGTVFTVTGTIKKHNSFRDKKETQLNRVKIH